MELSRRITHFMYPYYYLCGRGGGGFEFSSKHTDQADKNSRNEYEIKRALTEYET